MGSLVERVAKAVTDFTGQLSSAHAGALSQVWLPEVDEDGAIVLNTQGLPYAINGTGDLLALFRCISCKYKFATDLTKPLLMGAVGRVFTSGEPEMSHNVQQYDRSVFLRVAEAQRCRISSALFMPLYNSPKRDCVLGVYEVVQTQGEVLFPAVVDWLRCCLHEAGLYTADVDKHAFTMGLRPMPPEYNVSAFESGTAAVLQRHQQQQAAVEARRVGGPAPAGAGPAAGAMLPPPPPLTLGQTAEQPPSPLAAAAAVRAAAARVAAAAGAGAPVLAATAAQLLPPPGPHAAGEAQQLESRDERGDTLMGSSGPGGNPAHGGRMGMTVSVPSAKRARASSEPPPSREQEQQQPKAKPPDPKAQQQQEQPATTAAAVAAEQQQQRLGRPGGPALAGEEEEEEDGEDEVMQPAKPLPPTVEAGPQQPCSDEGGQVESSGMPLSGEGVQARTPQEGSGRGSNTQEKQQAGSSNPPSGLPAAPSYPCVQPADFIAGAGGLAGEAGSPAAVATAANGRASDGSSPNGMAAPAAGALEPRGSGEAVQPKLEKVATAAQLPDLEHLRQQKLLAAGRPGSAPPGAAWLGTHGLGSGDLTAAAAVMPSPRQEQQAKAGGQLSSAEPTTINQPMAAALASLLVQQQQQQQQQQQGAVTTSVAMPALLAQQAAGAPGLAGQQPLGRPPPAIHSQAQLLASAAAAASLLRSPSIPGGATGLPPRAGQPTLLPGGVLTVLPPSAQPQLFGATGAAGGSAADLARLGSGALARMGSGGAGGPADVGRIGSGGVGQKNLTLEDLKPHFGYGLKEAASRLGICPTTLKRTCRRLGISRWPRRQLVRLTKQHLGAAGKPEDLIGNRPPSTSDGSGSGDQPPVHMALRAPGPAGGLLGLSAGAGAAQAGGPGQASPAGASPAPGLLLALQQIQAAQQAQQQQAGAGEAVRGDGGGGLPQSLAANSPSLHQQLLQLQQQAGAGGPGGPAGLHVAPDHILLLQQLTAATRAGGAAQQQHQRQPPDGPGPAGPGSGSGPPLFLRGQQGGGVNALRPGGPGPPEAPWDLQQHLAAAAAQGVKEEDGEGGNTGLPQLLAKGNGHSSPMLDHQQRQQLGNEPASGPYTGLWPLSARPGSTLPAPPNGSQLLGTGVGDLSRAAAVAALQMYRVGGAGGGGGGGSALGLGHLMPRRGNSPTPPLPNGFSLGSVPRLGGDHPAESLDILAAADFDSVVNSPPGISNLGGLSNLGLSNLGMSNLDLPGGAGLEFSVGGYPGATSSQRP